MPLLRSLAVLVAVEGLALLAVGLTYGLVPLEQVWPTD